RKLRKRKTEKTVASRQRDVLTAVDRITDGRGGVVASRLIVPEVFPRPRIQRDDVSIARRREEHAARRGEHAIGERSLEQLEIPDGPARLGIDRFDPGVRCRVAGAPRRQRSRRTLAKIFAALLWS